MIDQPEKPIDQGHSLGCLGHGCVGKGLTWGRSVYVNMKASFLTIIHQAAKESVLRVMTQLHARRWAKGKVLVVNGDGLLPCVNG